MRTNPDHTRLRTVAIVCWLIGGWWITHLTHLYTLDAPSSLLVAKIIASIILAAVGIAFWQLGTDRRAGIVLDPKGMMLNLGHYAAFVSWDNIAAMGVCHHRSSLLALGSPHQLGLRLHDLTEFIQSYEERLPASGGPLGAALQLLAHLVRRYCPNKPDTISFKHLRQQRAHTGYDVLIPEAILGQKIETFIAQANAYQQALLQRRMGLQFRHPAAA